MLSLFFKLQTWSFLCLCQSFFRLLSQPTPPPPLSHCLHPTPLPYSLACLADCKDTNFQIHRAQMKLEKHHLPGQTQERLPVEISASDYISAYKPSRQLGMIIYHDFPGSHCGLVDTALVWGLKRAGFYSLGKLLCLSVTQFPHL